jgi:hypothetical protein
MQVAAPNAAEGKSMGESPLACPNRSLPQGVTPVLVMQAVIVGIAAQFANGLSRWLFPCAACPCHPRTR